MMENKYFTPDIGDIRVGYECEIKPKGSKEFDWMSYKVHSGISINRLFNDSIRTQYLTKEQIEAEGWEASREYPCHNFRKNEEISCFYKDNLLLVYKNVRCIFDGQCKDINTFRYICKLLNI